MSMPTSQRPERTPLTATASARAVVLLPLVAALLLTLGAVAGTHPQPALALALGAASTLVTLGLFGALAGVAAVVLLHVAHGPRPALAAPRIPARQHDPDTDGRPRPRAPGASLLPRAA
jgi:hypothetical protein